MSGKFSRTVFNRIFRAKKNSRGQGMLETQLVTILFFTVTMFGVIDMARLIFMELKAFEASYMCCRIAVVTSKEHAQAAALQMFNPIRVPYVDFKTEQPPGQNYDNGMRRCTLKFYYTANIMFPGLLQPVYDIARKSNDTLDPFVVMKGMGVSIVDFIGPSSVLNGYYYEFKASGGEMTHPVLGIVPAGCEWMKMMGYPGHGPYTF